MKCILADSKLEFTVLSLLLTFSLIYGTPSKYSLFQGSAYSGAAPRPRNKNWCAYVVHKNVTCAVLASTESSVESELAPCPVHLPDCAQQLMYRTRFRPTYKIGYKVVTELEWRCCPAFQGPNCRDLKDAPPKPTLMLRPPTHTLAGVGHTQQTQIPESGESGLRGQQLQDGEKVRHLEEEVQRLSQTVLDLQAAMTGMNENLRVNIQEDTSKMLVTLLNNMRPPNSALTGATESIRLQEHGLGQDPRVLEEVMARLSDVTDTLKSKSDILEELQSTVSGHDGQLRLLLEAAQSPQATAPAPQPLTALQTYFDGKIADLRHELMEGIEIKMADLKNTCEYQIASMQEQCEGHDSSYLSLAELLDSKEADLRKEIQDLKLNVDGEDSALRKEVGRISEAHQALNARLDSELGHLSTLQTEDVFSQRFKDLEARVNATVKNCEENSIYMEDKMNQQIADKVKQLRNQMEEKLITVEEQFTTMLVEINNCSTSGVDSLAVDTLQSEVNSNMRFIQDLEKKVNALGEACSKDCSSNKKTIENILQDVKICRSDLDVMNSDVGGNSDKIRELEDLLQGRLQSEQQNSKDFADLQGVVISLKDNVGGLGFTVASLAESLSIYSQDLQYVNSTCGQTGVDCQQEAKEMRELLDSRLIGAALDVSQVEELKRGLVQLSGQVSAELSQCKETTEGVKKEVSSVDGRVANVENACSKLDTMSDSLLRIKEGLNKHVTSLWTCINHINATMRVHSVDIGGLKGSVQEFHTQLSDIAQDFQDLATSSPTKPGANVRQGNPKPPTETRIHIPVIIPQRTPPVTTRPRQPTTRRQTSGPHPPNGPQKPVIEAGEAGPPGTMRRTLLKLPQSDGAMPTFTGYAGAPGYPPQSPVPINPKINPVAHTPKKPVSHKTVVARGAGDHKPGEPFSFSAGITVMPFSGETGVIRFNKVLVNDGGHYDPHTGVFTAPADGRYLVSAVLTAQRGERVQAVLSVSNRSVQRLDSWGYRQAPGEREPSPAPDSCSCGGSASLSLALSLKRGDRVGLVLTGGKLAVTESRDVLSTFSAVFLYSPPSST
ncbi:EMILIN-2 [Anguilla anguilla]|uniref:EMILIN-2 n=1 Tax=Anguilla anguilla TaxID=7936 RepID=UPI0015AA4562|nr:EMILIN-2 [Anguilla anguilla]